MDRLTRLRPTPAATRRPGARAGRDGWGPRARPGRGRRSNGWSHGEAHRERESPRRRIRPGLPAARLRTGSVGASHSSTAAPGAAGQTRPETRAPVARVAWVSGRPLGCRQVWRACLSGCAPAAGPERKAGGRACARPCDGLGGPRASGARRVAFETSPYRRRACFRSLSRQFGQHVAADPTAPGNAARPLILPSRKSRDRRRSIGVAWTRQIPSSTIQVSTSRELDA